MISPVRRWTLWLALLVSPMAAFAAPTPSPSPSPSPLERVGAHWGATPIANYTTDRGLTIGAMSQRFDYGGTGKEPFENLVTFWLSYGTRGPTILGVNYEMTGLTSADLRLFTQFLYYYDPFHRYYGLGPDSQYNGALELAGYNYYLFRAGSLEMSLRKNLARGLDAQVGITGVVESSQPNGPDTQYEIDFGPNALQQNYAKLEAGFVLERRDSEFIPTRGDFATLLFTATPSWLSNGAGWAGVFAEYRRYFPLIENSWLWFAVQAQYSATTAEAPLAERPVMGSILTLRGYPLNRFIDNQAVGLRGELRSTLLRLHFLGLPAKGGVGLFVDSGRVADTLWDLGSSPTRLGYGISFFGSYFTDDFVGSADVGFSEDGAELYLHLAHAF